METYRTPRRRFVALALSGLILLMISPYAAAMLTQAASDRNVPVLAVFAVLAVFLVVGLGWARLSAVRRLRGSRRRSRPN